MGVEVTADPVVAERSVDGDHEYPDAPLAVNITELPEHTVALDGETATDGFAFTIMVDELLVVLHAPLVTSTR